MLYLDSSALLKLLVEEPGSAETEAATAEATQLATVALTYVEVHSALARMKAGRRLSERQRGVCVDIFSDIWGDLAVVPVSESLIHHAAQLADRHLLRGYDAVHLAGALELVGAGPTSFASWDDRLNVAAAKERLTLLSA